MKIGIVGATGKQGNLTLKEAVKRGHEVTAFIRDAGHLKDNVTIVETDLYDITPDMVEDLDVVVNAFNAAPNLEVLHQSSLRHLTATLKDLETRLIVVGGAGSLYMDESRETQLQETPDFPEDFKATATNMGLALDELKESEGTTWTYISPAADFQYQGERTGEYQLAGDILTLNSAGKSVISYADYAIGLVDEIENGKHLNEQISLVSK